MGLFVLPLGTSKADAVKAVIGNAKLWLEYAEKGVNLDHLFIHMKCCLDEAQSREPLTSEGGGA